MGWRHAVVGMYRVQPEPARRAELDELRQLVKAQARKPCDYVHAGLRFAHHDVLARPALEALEQRAATPVELQGGFAQVSLELPPLHERRQCRLVDRGTAAVVEPLGREQIVAQPARADDVAEAQRGKDRL